MTNSVKKISALILFVAAFLNLEAQDETTASKFTSGADLYSNYIWRGSRYGTGPHFQPSVKLTSGGLTAGVWGSFDFNGYSEADPYITYAFPFGLSLGLTDYYYPGLAVFDFSDATGSHALELNAGFAKGGFSLAANYIMNEAGGAGSSGSDLYFQAAYAFKNVNLWLGAGNGWHTVTRDFNICNVGIGTTRNIELTDKFSVPLTGQLILNPDREQLYLVAGFTF
jgi:hypothetical protein